MIGLRQVLLTAALAVSLTLAGPSESALNADEQREWRFRVYLDDKEIGYHNFRLTSEADRVRLETEADMRVRFLFLTAYRYEHVNEEIWSGDCLEQIEARTDDNGKVLTVRGERDAARFLVTAGEEPVPMDGCVKSFAYWNPDILDEEALLNSQTGKLLEVDVQQVSRESVDVRGEQIPATRFRLLGEKIKIDLWYSDSREWLGLESTIKGGRKLRYVLS